MTRKKPELPEWDDGRTISDMNVDGMLPRKKIILRKNGRILPPGRRC